MSEFIAIPASLLAAYLLGSMPTGYLFARILKGIDIRQHGSRNVGATNVARTVGKVPGVIVLIIDIAKGVLAVTLLTRSFYPSAGGIDFVTYRALMGFAVICGHIWTVFLKFKGGKGVATMLGAMSVISPLVFFSSGVVWLFVFFMTKYVSLSSIFLAVSCPIFAVIAGEPASVVVFTIVVCLITTYRHKANIIRLLNKTESKLKLFSGKG